MRIDQTTCADIAAALTTGVETPHTIRVDFGGTVVAVHTNDPGLAAELEDYFKEFLAETGADIEITALETDTPEFVHEFSVKTPDPGKTKIKEEWFDLPDGRIVRKRLTGMHFVFGRGVNLAVGPCLENPNQVINFVNNRFIEKMLQTGAFLGHAAGVVHCGRGISLAGFSGMGKSTLALHLMSRGTTFVSNDRIMVAPDADGGLTMYGVAKQPRINPGTALHNEDLSRIMTDVEKERFAAMPPDELWQLEHKYDALIDQCYGEGRFALKAPMTGLVILNWTRDGGETVVRSFHPADRPDLLPAFMKGTGLFYLPEGAARADGTVDPALEEYADLLERCQCVEISGGVDFDKAADACLAFLEHGELTAA